MPQAILFDLDCTLTDRPQSIVHYAERFYQDFVNSLRRTTAHAIAAVIQTAAGAGYRPSMTVALPVGASREATRQQQTGRLWARDPVWPALA